VIGSQPQDFCQWICIYCKLSRARHKRQISWASPLRTCLPRSELIAQLCDISSTGRLQPGLRILTDYVGASHYLLARADLLQEAGLDFVVSSDWPFDLVTNLAEAFVGGFARATELEKCMQLFRPHFAVLPTLLTCPMAPAVSIAR
jgi:hypothetical protein